MKSRPQLCKAGADRGLQGQQNAPCPSAPQCMRSKVPAQSVIHQKCQNFCILEAISASNPWVSLGLTYWPMEINQHAGNSSECPDDTSSGMHTWLCSFSQLMQGTGPRADGAGHSFCQIITAGLFIHCHVLMLDGETS